MVNALNHAFDEKQESVIEIKVEQATNNRVRLSVLDNGIGANGEIKADIFEPFYTTARGNTGLGLYYSLSMGNPGFKRGHQTSFRTTKRYLF